MAEMISVYSKTPALKSKPKDQRSIIADILLAADRPMTVREIAAEALKARYDTEVPIEESIQWHVKRMALSRAVKQGFEG
jgi:hypothetical protein